MDFLPGFRPLDRFVAAVARALILPWCSTMEAQDMGGAVQEKAEARLDARKGGQQWLEISEKTYFCRLVRENIPKIVKV